MPRHTILGRSQPDIQRHHLLALLLQREGQKGVNGANPVDLRTVDHVWLEGLGQLSQASFGLNQVGGGQKLVAVENVFRVGAHLVAEYGQYAHYLAALLSLQLAYAVVGLHHLCRFYKHGLARGALVVYNAVYLAFHTRCHGYHQAAVAQRGCSVFIHQPFALCRVQYCI